MVSDYVSPHLLAAERIKTTVRGAVAEANAQQKRRSTIIIFVVFVVFAVLIGVAIVLANAVVTG